MKTRLLALIRRAWELLTVIPGWPDAGRLTRGLYVLPLVLPLVALAGLFAWSSFVQEPRIRRVRAACEPGLQLEREIAELRLASSDEQATAATESLTTATAGLAESPEQLAARLQAMQEVALARGWNASFHANDVVAPPPGSLLAHRTLRGRLNPTPAHPTPFTSLLAVLEELFPPEAHGGLTRLTVRADEQGLLSAELGARLAVLPPDAKTP